MMWSPRSLELRALVSEPMPVLIELEFSSLVKAMKRMVLGCGLLANLLASSSMTATPEALSSAPGVLISVS